MQHGYSKNLSTVSSCSCLQQWLGEPVVHVHFAVQRIHTNTNKENALAALWNAMVTGVQHTLLDHLC